MRSRICWPWCECRRGQRAIREEIRAINYVEGVGGWIPSSEAARRDLLRERLKE